MLRGVWLPCVGCLTEKMSETRYRQKLSPNGHENQANGFPTVLANNNNASSENRVYKIEEIPDYLRFNPFVKAGYRRQMNAKECCQSLLFFHNETVNIYTHGKSIILIVQ